MKKWMDRAIALIILAIACTGIYMLYNIKQPVDNKEPATYSELEQRLELAEQRIERLTDIVLKNQKPSR